MPRRFAVLALVASLLAAATACGGDGESSASCADVIKYRGEVRFGTWVGDFKGPWPDLDGSVKAYRPSCDDGGGAIGGHETRVYKLKGIAPEVALVTHDRKGLYLGEAYFLNSRSHPLHDLLFNSPDEPDESRGKPCRPLEGASGLITAVDGRGAQLTVAGTEPWRVDAFTEIRAPRVHGVPLPRVGQQARVEGVLCGKTRRVARLIAVG